MGASPLTILLLALAIAAANLPFLSGRLFGIVRFGRDKGFLLRLAELVALYFSVGGLAAVLERDAYGTVYPQGWEFYAVTACLFLVLAYPGFAYRYLLRRA